MEAFKNNKQHLFKLRKFLKEVENLYLCVVEERTIGDERVELSGRIYGSKTLLKGNGKSFLIDVVEQHMIGGGIFYKQLPSNIRSRYNTYVSDTLPIQYIDQSWEPSILMADNTYTYYGRNTINQNIFPFTSIETGSTQAVFSKNGKHVL